MDWWPTILRNHELLSQAFPPEFRDGITSIEFDGTTITIQLQTGARVERRPGTSTVADPAHGLLVSLWLACSGVSVTDQLLVGLAAVGPTIASQYIFFPDLQAIAEYQDGESIGPQINV